MSQATVSVMIQHHLKSNVRKSKWYLNNILFSFAGQTVRFRILRPSLARAPEAQVPGGDSLLDESGGDFPAPLRPRGRHLVSGHHDHGDGGRGATLLQRAAPPGHEENPGHATAKAEKPSKGNEDIQLRLKKCKDVCVFNHRAGIVELFSGYP